MAIDIDAARRLTRAAVIGRAGKRLGTVRPGPTGTVQSNAGSNS
jgi:hypothetical protein